MKVSNLFTGVAVLFLLITNAVAETSGNQDNYDKYFSNDWAKEIIMDEGNVVFKMADGELYWDEDANYFLPIDDSIRNCISVDGNGLNDVQDILRRDGLLERDIFTNALGETIHVGKDYSDSLSVEQIDIPSVHGKIPSFLYKKKDSEIKRVVVYVHGGAFEDCINDTIFFRPELHFLLDHETAIYAINTTGDADCNGDYPEYPDKIKREIDVWATSEIDDILNAYEIVNKKYPKKPVLLFGFSHGAYLTNLVASKYADRSKFSAYISMFGAWDNSMDDFYSHAATKGRLAISDRHFSQDDCLECEKGFYSYFTYPEKVSSDHGKKTLKISDKLSHAEAKKKLEQLRKEGQDVDMLYYQAEDSLYERTNPSLYISKIDRPFFSVHGDQDRNVRSVNSDVLHNKLSDIQKSMTKVYKFPNEGHGIFTRDNFNMVTQDLLEFIQ